MSRQRLTIDQIQNLQQSLNSNYYNDVRKLRAYWMTSFDSANGIKMGTWTGTATNAVSFEYPEQSKWGNIQKSSLATAATAGNQKVIYLSGTANHTFRKDGFSRNIFTVKIGAAYRYVLTNASFVVAFSTQSFLANPFGNTDDFSGVATSTDFFGIGCRSTDANLHIIYRASSVEALTFVDLGSNFPRPVNGSTGTIAYELFFKNLAHETNIEFTVNRIDTGDTITSTYNCFNSNPLVLYPTIGIRTADAALKYISFSDMMLYNWVE